MRLILAVFLAVSIAGTAFAKSRDPIRIAAGETAAQQVVAFLVARTLKRSGFKSEFVTVPTDAMVDALKQGAVHANPSAQVAGLPRLEQSIEAGEVRSLGGLANNKRSAPVQKLVWPGMKKKWPYAQKMLKRMVLLDADVEALSKAVEAGGAPEDVAKAWWKANPKSWKPWVAASTNWMKP